MKYQATRRRAFRTAAVILLPGQVLLGAPLNTLAQEAQDRPTEAAETTSVRAAVVNVNRTTPKVEPVPAFPSFSATPSAAEIGQARVFGEPLVPMGGTPSAEENAALAQALMGHLRAGGGEDLSRLELFLEKHPRSPWRVSLRVNMGLAYRRAGYFTRALARLEQGWDEGREETEPRASATAELALAELLHLNMLLGRHLELERLLAQAAGRDVGGSAGEKLQWAQRGLWLLQNEHHHAIPSGPTALDRILAYGNPGYVRPPLLRAFKPTMDGASLRQMEDLAASVGMGLRMGFRDGEAEIPLPALVHLKVGHFSAVVRQEGGQYVLHDPILGQEIWMSRRALQEEASGYFLIREEKGGLPAGWRAVADGEAAKVRGKCTPCTWGNPGALTHCEKKTGCDECTPGLAVYGLHLLLANLNITDTPVGYSPPRGPAVRFEVTYNHRETMQPAVFSYVNLGPKWTLDWLSYVEDNPANPNDLTRVYARGGGYELQSGFNATTQSYAMQLQSRATLVRTSPTSYERRLADGSVEVFDLVDGATSPRRVFMTKIRDPQNQALTFTYDSSLQLVAATDAINQVTTISYAPDDSGRITKVTDPFGRFATFEYDSAGRLQKITDVIGLTSEFTYTLTDFVSLLTTPYGVSKFSHGGHGGRVWVQATDPLGGMELVEYSNLETDLPAQELPANVPAGFDNPNPIYSHNQNLNTFFTAYWDKRAAMLYPGDYSKAQLTTWLRHNSLEQYLGVPRSVKRPLENRVWYAYPGQTNPLQVGTHAQPSKTARVLDDGQTQLYQYEYNFKGKLIKYTDPLRDPLTPAGRETRYTYGTGSAPDADQANGSGIDLLKVEQKNPAGQGGYDLLASQTYNAQHLPLTVTDAAGQTTTFRYLPNGRTETVETPPRNGLNGQPLTQAERTTTYAYYPDNAQTGGGQLQTVTGPSTPQGSPITTFNYDGYARVRTTTDTDNYTLTYDYDALDRRTKITYPDGTYEETAYNRLDAEGHRDRLGRWSHVFHDAVRRVIATRDPLGRTITQQWCSCGSLEKLIDANGNATTWARDEQGRTKREVRPDNAAWEYTYENTTSRLKERKDPKLQVTRYEYLLDNQLQQITYVGALVPTANVSFAYDANYDRLTRMTDGTGITNYAYHQITVPPARGASRLANVDGPLASDTVSYTYDEVGNVASRGLTGFVSTFAFDALGRLGTQGSPLGTFTYTFDGLTPRPLRLTYPNSQTTQYAYLPNSGDHRLHEIKHLAPGGGVLSKFNYTYDANENVKTWTQQLAPDPARMYEMGYDVADQLTTATLKSTIDPVPVILKRYGYAYDPAANRTTEQVDDAATSWTTNNRNQLTSRQAGGALIFRGTVNEPATVSVQGTPAQVAPDNRFEGAAQVPSGTSTVTVVAQDYAQPANVRTNTYQINVSGAGTTTYSYDLNGNLTSDGTKTYAWDAEDRLVRVLQGATELAHFVYDGQGRRSQKVVGTLTRTYVYDAAEIVEERVSTGQTVRYLQGPGIDQHLASQDGVNVSYYLADHLGSMVQVTNNGGAVTLVRQYDSWGNLLAGAGTSGWAFTGREWDAETGLYYYRARYYDPKIGRFLSEDPLPIRDRQTEEINPYAYVQNDPTNRTDPWGLESGAEYRWQWCIGNPACGPRPDTCENRLNDCKAGCFQKWMLFARATCVVVCTPFVKNPWACSASCTLHMAVPYKLCLDGCDAKFKCGC